MAPDSVMRPYSGGELNLKGFPLGLRSNLRLSLIITSAALVNKSCEMPLAIRVRDPIEQGDRWSWCREAEPESKGCCKIIGFIQFHLVRYSELLIYFQVPIDQNIFYSLRCRPDPIGQVFHIIDVSGSEHIPLHWTPWYLKQFSCYSWKK